jgi:glutathione synthase/RimK-type ligase-like ATP-grasp enzyme
MVQKLVEADRDVTVAVVRDSLFAFEQSRNALHDRLVDWRELSGDAAPNAWRRHQLPPGLESAIFAFMDEMGLQFGRLDFLLNELGYHFLEVNTNGEWAWLDPDGRHGLLPKVVDEISPDTPIHPIPFPRGIG